MATFFKQETGTPVMCEDIKDKLRELREVCLEAGEVRKDSSLSPPPASCCPHFWKKTGTN